MTASNFNLKKENVFKAWKGNVLGAPSNRWAAAKSLIHFSVEFLASMICVMEFPLAAEMKHFDAECFCLAFSFH